MQTFVDYEAKKRALQFEGEKGREMRSDTPRPPPAIWLRTLMHGHSEAKEKGDSHGFSCQSIAMVSSCLEKKFLAWHRARLTPLVDLE